MANAVNISRLIEEIQKRPALWNLKKGELKSRSSAPKLWQDVADALGTDVVYCKRKWKNLRDAYRAEVRRSERRMERDKLIGKYDPSANYASKWLYFESLTFLNEAKRPRYTLDFDNSTNSNDEIYDQQLPSSQICGIKIELDHSHDDDRPIHHVHFANDDVKDDGNDEAANDMLFEEFQNIATPQAARRLSATLSMTNSTEHSVSNDASEKGNVESANSKCKCSEQTAERVHFLEDLEKEEQKLMQSTNHDIKSALDHVGDSDYNFLVSFLPQMKKMTDLQNLQFRARMCDLLLNIMAPTMSTRNSPLPPPMTPAPGIAHLEAGDRLPAINLLQFPVSVVNRNNEGHMIGTENYMPERVMENPTFSTSCNNIS